MSTSDKLFFWMFQNHPDSLLRLLRDLPADATGYRFSAPVLKEREYRLDGLFLPPENRQDLPAVILEAQMATDQGFLRRLYAESSRWLQQHQEIDQWRVVVICPHRGMNFGRPEAVAEFIQERVRWIELLPAAADPTAVPLLRALALLVQPEEQIPASTAAIRTRVAATAEEKEMADVIAAILLTRFNSRSIQEICAMGGITLEEFSQTVAYKEIFGQGRQEGRQEGREEGELDLALRLLRHRCGQLSAEQQALIRALSLSQLEALADALLDFQGADDLNAWLAAH